MVSSFVPVALCERQFTLKSAVQGFRVDGRQMLEARDIAIHFYHNGTVELQFGATRVLAACTAWIGEPRADRPMEGYLQINSDFSRMSIPADTRIPLARTVSVNRILERVFRESHCIDLEALCIVAAQAVWNVRVDLTVLDYDGSVLDALVLGTTLALAHFRLPNYSLVNVDDEQLEDKNAGRNSGLKNNSVRVEVSANEQERVSMPLRFRPVAATVALLGEARVGRAGGTLLLDACATEEQVASGCVLFVANRYSQLCAVQTLTPARFTATLLDRCAKVALERCAELVRVCDEALEQESAAYQKDADIGVNAGVYRYRAGLSSITQQERKARECNARRPPKVPISFNEEEEEEEDDLENEDDYDDDDDDEQIQEAAARAQHNQGSEMLVGTDSVSNVGATAADTGNPSNDPNEEMADADASDSEESIVQTLPL